MFESNGGARALGPSNEIEVGSRFDAVDSRFDAVDSRFDAVDSRFDAVDSRFDRLDQRIDWLEERLDRRMGSMQASLDALRSDLTHVALAVGVRPRATNP